MATTNTTSNLIAAMESYLCPSLPVGRTITPDPTLPALHLLPTPTLTKLRNVGSARVRHMRTLGHSRQIISHLPITAPPQTCTKFNDALYTAIRMNADKFAALALLPGGVGEGKEAARELQRCVSKYGFVGGVLGLKRGNGSEGGVGDRSDGSYEELWAAADKLRVPIALRELWPAGSEVSFICAWTWEKSKIIQIPSYEYNLPDTVVAPLLSYIHTTHSASPLPLLQLYLSGVFDRHPALRLVLCHPGALPSLLPRIETLLSNIPGSNKPSRPFLNIWQHNIYLTTADVQEMSTMRALLEQIPMDRVLYASNYPLEERGGDLMKELNTSGFLTKEEYDRVAFANAEALFGLKGTTAKRV